MMQAKRKSAFRKFFTVSSCAIAIQAGLLRHPLSQAQEYGYAVDRSTDAETLFFPLAQFKIPFNVESTGTQPSQVQLWVSTDEGASWQLHGSATTDRRAFDFRAAAEGLYLFSVRTLDESGRAFASPQPPMRIMIDTTKPYVELRADVNSVGQIVADVRISEAHLKPETVRLRYRTDQETEWHEVAVDNLVAAGQVYEGQVTLDIKQCREVGLVVTVADEAANIGDATFQYTMPRTASANQEMVLASQRNNPGETASVTESHASKGLGRGTPTSGSKSAPWQGSSLVPTPGAVVWPPTKDANTAVTNTAGEAKNVVPPQVSLTQLAPPQASATTSAAAPQTGGWSVSGKLAGAPGGLSLEGSQPLPLSTAEELPPPPAINQEQSIAADQRPSPDNPLPVSSSPKNGSPKNGELDSQLEFSKSTPPAAANAEPSTASSPFGQAFHCNSRAFSLDYALNEVAGSALADVELWGTEDGGRVWQRWGSDPDRQSPFDVQVANDGLFGFRMVIVSQNGTVSNRPKDGDSADAWINVDTAQPAVKITRAVYGEGHEAGLLVLDYTCSDANLHERPLTLSYSETLNGPWVTITTGLKNTGIYLWKPPASLPEHVFLRLEAVDRAGNVGTHRLDLPINIQGLAPRGRIQGFRPINNP